MEIVRRDVDDVTEILYHHSLSVSIFNEVWHYDQIHSPVADIEANEQHWKHIGSSLIKTQFESC